MYLVVPLPHAQHFGTCWGSCSGGELPEAACGVLLNTLSGSVAVHVNQSWTIAYGLAGGAMLLYFCCGVW